MRILRINLALLLMTCTSLQAQNDKEITITGDYEKLIPLKTFLQKLSNEYELTFFYQEEWIEQIDMYGTYDGVPLSEVLTKILYPWGYKVKMVDFKNYVILPEDFGNELEVTNDTDSLGTASQGDVTIGSSNSPNPGTHTLSGYIKDGKNGDELIGASIYVAGSERGTISNELGFYKITLPTGAHKLRVSLLGYREHELSVQLYESGEYNIELFETITNLESVTVTAKAPDSNVRDLKIGVQNLSIKNLKKQPALMGEVDIVKNVLTLPGVSTVGEGAAGFNVRGGGVGENLILQDGMEIFYSSHLFGLFSTFNPYVVRDVSLYKGGSVPAQFGGRLSSILDVKLRNGNLKEFGGNAGLGMIMSHVTLEGPVVKDKISFLVGGRMSYSDWILKSSKNLDLKSSGAGFNDANFKIMYEANSKNRISITGYHSQDRFNFLNDTTYRYGSQALALNWDHSISDKTYFSLNGVIGKYKYTIRDISGLNQFKVESSVSYRSVKPRLVFDLSDNHELEVGLQANLYNIGQAELAPAEDAINLEAVDVPEQIALESAGFISGSWQILKGFGVTYGLRYSDYRALGEGVSYVFDPDQPKSQATIIDTIRFSKNEVMANYAGLEPRISFNLGLSDKSSIKGSYSRMRQNIHLVSNTAAAAPVDVWQSSNRHIRPAISDQYSIGYFRNLKDNSYELSLQVYYKKSEDLLEFKDGARLLLNEIIETDLLQGEGRSRGVEFLLKKTQGLLVGSFSYTYSRTEMRTVGSSRFETINFGEYYPANFDRPHDLTVTTEYKLGRRVSFNANFTYSSGRPITAPSFNYTQGLSTIAHFSRRNAHRIPAYHRLDLGLTVGTGFKNAKKFKSEWAFSIYNIYSRKNAFSVYFDQHANAYKLALFGIFPSVSYNIVF